MNELKNQYELRIVEGLERNKYLIINDEKVSKFRLLALASNAETKEDAWSILSLASILFHPEDDPAFNTLYSDVASGIAMQHKVTEASIQERFNKSVKRIFGDTAKVVKKKCDCKHIPDSWVKMDGFLLPVEIKLNEFDEKALKQLQRYMKFYKVESGVAVGKALTADLPINIIFVPISSLDK